MSADASEPKSAFAPFVARSDAPNSSDILMARPFAYCNSSQDKYNRWIQHPGFIVQVPVSDSRCKCAGQVDQNVINDIPTEKSHPNVLISNDGFNKNGFVNPHDVVNSVDYLNSVNAAHQFFQAGVGLTSSSYNAVPTAFSSRMLAPAPVVPLLLQPQLAGSDTLPSRQGYYRKRHHPSCKTASNYEPSASELKNKTRFSATGLSGQAAVVRDCKMSLSSSPPSPSAGSVGGSLCSLVSRSHFKPIPSPCQLFSSVRNSVTVLPYSSTKKMSTSASPTSSSISPLSRSSTSSSSSLTSRKRRADEESGQEYYRSSGYSSTSDVIAGVGHVRLCDRSSTGSVSPIEVVSRASDCASQQLHKRSKNDHEEDDDVIFVSMESAPAAPAQKLTARKSIRRVKKGANKVGATASKQSVPTMLPVPTSIYPIQHPQPYSVSMVNPFSAPSPTCVQPSPLAVAGTSLPKGYYLRSSVNIKPDIITNEKINSCNPTEVRSNPSEIARYNTRSHQKRQLETFQVSPELTKSGAESSRNIQKNIAKAGTPSNLHGRNELENRPILVASSSTPRETPRVVILDEPHQRNVRVSSLKNYDIKGKIGVGGGGVVYAGTRKSDDVQVAIKRVPKDKVKRWGKLDGRVVPIEFELLYRAAKSGNRGVIKMFDWYERRGSYVLVMERPQPVIDLFDYLNQHGAMHENIAKKIFRQIVEAVRHCHANGVVHRDIKDENVLLNLHTSEAKLIDFGCGTFMKNEPYTEFAGTPEFYPPEWFTERRYEGRKVDAWSLGVLLYTMVEAEVPFQKEEDIIRCQLRHKRLVTSSSSLCRHLIAMMLQKDQTKRPTLEEVLQHPWLNDDPIPLQSASNSSPASVSVEERNDILSSAQNLSQLCKPGKKSYQPNVVVQFEEVPSFSSPSYVPYNAVRSKECVVQS